MLEISEITMLEDRETGEVHFDLETGEMNLYPVANSWSFSCLDAETGELEPEVRNLHQDQKRIFQVPKSALRDSQRSSRRRKSRGQPHVTVVSATHKDENVSKDENTSESETIYKRLYTRCLPVLVLLMFLPAWVASLCVVLEWLLHGIAHHTNKIGCFRFYSPLCYFTSNMCAMCESQRAAEKVIKIQDRRKLRAINKKLEYLNYVNTVLS